MGEKSQPEAASLEDHLPLLPDDVPVIMPDLPSRLTISTEQQFKAISDMARSRILGVIQHQPLTAKQIAQRLQATTGAIGHHLHVLEEAGLVKVVARRITRGIVASYYTRAARIYDYDLPLEVRGDHPIELDIFARFQAELMDSIISNGQEDTICSDAFPHIRLSLEKAMEYRQRFNALIDEIIEEKPDPNGEVYGVFYSIFKSPPYMQVDVPPDGFPPGEADL
ncbi:MAG TPA: winged helix-turn-helix domain-containing protein [Ktedonobacteraceae bacterium]